MNWGRCLCRRFRPRKDISQIPCESVLNKFRPMICPWNLWIPRNPWFQWIPWIPWTPWIPWISGFPGIPGGSQRYHGGCPRMIGWDRWDMGLMDPKVSIYMSGPNGLTSVVKLDAVTLEIKLYSKENRCSVNSSKSNPLNRWTFFEKQRYQSESMYAPTKCMGLIEPFGGQWPLHLIDSGEK